MRLLRSPTRLDASDASKDAEVAHSLLRHATGPKGGDTDPHDADQDAVHHEHASPQVLVRVYVDTGPKDEGKDGDGVEGEGANDADREADHLAPVGSILPRLDLRDLASFILVRECHVRDATGPVLAGQPDPSHKAHA